MPIHLSYHIPCLVSKYECSYLGKKAGGGEVEGRKVGCGLQEAVWMNNFGFKNGKDGVDNFIDLSLRNPYLSKEIRIKSVSL